MSALLTEFSSIKNLDDFQYRVDKKIKIPFSCWWHFLTATSATACKLRHVIAREQANVGTPAALNVTTVASYQEIGNRML